MIVPDQQLSSRGAGTAADGVGNAQLLQVQPLKYPANLEVVVVTRHMVCEAGNGLVQGDFRYSLIAPLSRGPHLDWGGICVTGRDVTGGLARASIKLLEFFYGMSATRPAFV